MLDRIQTLECIRKAKIGDDEAKEKLIISNTNLIKSIVKRFLGKGIEYDDLFQLGCLGFIKAVANFNEKYEVMFSTYAVPMIIGEIKRFLRDDGAIKVSRSIKLTSIKINRYINDFRQIHDSSPTVEQIADFLKIEESDVVFAMDASRYPISIYDEGQEDDDAGNSLVNKLASKDTQDEIIDSIMLRQIIDELPERERKIIILRYFRDKTQSEIAVELGVSQVQISRLESKILEKIRNSLQEIL